MVISERESTRTSLQQGEDKNTFRQSIAVQDSAIVFSQTDHKVKKRTGKALHRVDRYLRRKDTILAKTLQNTAPQTGEDYARSGAKRVLDIAVGVPATIFSAPAVVGLAGMNKALEPDQPAFFRQMRSGNNGESLEVIKIRSMQPNSDYDTTGVEVHQGLHAAENPRNTRIGSFMRRFDLDELPQLPQAVKGQMSVVGIRPLPYPVIETVENNWSVDRFSTWKKAYETTNKGLTGMDQAFNGRDKRDVTRFHRDVFYAKHASLGLDLYLLTRTALRALRLL